jgi:hypothetical protein
MRSVVWRGEIVGFDGSVEELRSQIGSTVLGIIGTST